jgi:hypothetical protein
MTIAIVKIKFQLLNPKKQIMLLQQLKPQNRKRQTLSQESQRFLPFHWPVFAPKKH